VPLKRPRKCKVHDCTFLVFSYAASYPCHSVRSVEAQVDRFYLMASLKGGFQLPVLVVIAVLGYGKE